MENSYGKLILLQDGLPEQEFNLNKISVTIGRGMTNDIVLGDGRASRSHGRIECGPQGCTYRDLKSSNGSRLNGHPVEQAILRPGDSLILGNTVMRYEVSSEFRPADLTIIDNEADLNFTLEREILPVSLNETSTPRLVVFTKEKTWEVPLENIDQITIGRTDESDVTIPHTSVSRRHAEIYRKGGLYILKDLGSTNGTWLRDQRVEELILQNDIPFRIGPATLIYKSGFSEEALTLAGEMLAITSARRPVIFVPGMAGSELWLGNERLWPNVRQIFNSPERLRYKSDDKIEARGIVNEVVIIPNLLKMDQYNRLGDYLVEDLGYERGKDFFEFAYDWRQDVRTSSRQLAQFIESIDLKAPAILIGHSLGTLVIRYYVECLGGKQHTDRMMLMGGPHKGVPKSLTSLLKSPDMLPFGLMGERMRKVLATFPSSYQILPTYSCVVDQNGKKIDLFANDHWVHDEQRPLLQAARQFRKELGARSSIPAVSIFGYGIKTISSVSLTTTGTGEFREIVLNMEPCGDDGVPQVSGVLDASEIHPVHQHHGSLFTDNDVKMRLKMELTRVSQP